MILEFTFNYRILFLFIFPIFIQFESPIIKLYIGEKKIVYYSEYLGYF